MQIFSLHIYPVKSMRGINVDHARLDGSGLCLDRRFMVVDSTGSFVTQREVPALATISTAIAGNSLVLSCAGITDTGVSLASDETAAIRKVGIWKHAGLLAEDCGDDVACWLRQILQGDYRLVRAGAQFRRNVLKQAAVPDDRFAFADGAPVLVCSTASLQELNNRITSNGGTALPMDRFRPNIVVSGSDAFGEDDWPAFTAGEATFKNAGPSERCSVTTTDQMTGERGKEPLRTLAAFRRLPLNPNGVFFGTNYINVSKEGLVSVGDSLTVASE
jgi:uncharacterized protein YcbX